MTMPRQILVTGDRPTGRLHLGHLVGSLQNRVRLQDEFDCFFLVADIHMLTTHFDKVEEVESNVLQMVIDWLSVGMDPERSTFYIQSGVRPIFVLSSVLSMLCAVPRAQRLPSLKEKIDDLGVGENYSVGLLGYPVLMAADILMFKATRVPVGEDQLSHIELTRELARRFNFLYGDFFPEPEAVVSPEPRLVGLDGQRKMSKSLDNHLALSHSPEEIETRVRGMFTDQQKLRKGDPGRPEICAVYAYHKIFGTENLDDIDPRCRSGELGCVECKKRVLVTLERVLAPIREKRAQYEKSLDTVRDVLREGTRKAAQIADQNLEECIQAMGLYVA